MRNIILILSLAFVGTACLDSEKKAHIARIDQMSAELDSVNKIYTALPLDSFSIIREIAQNNESYIKQYYVDDTIDVDFARAMNRYKAIRKGSGFISQKRNFLDTVFTFQISQLDKLKTDISNGVGKREKYGSYIDSEEVNINLIRSSFNDFQERFNHLRNEYYELNPIVEDMVEKLKKGE